MIKELTFADKIMIIFLIIACIFGFYFFYLAVDNEKDTVNISINGELVDTYPIGIDNIVKIKADNNNADLVTHILVIENNEFYISEALCNDKICMNNALNTNSITCLPFRLVIN